MNPNPRNPLPIAVVAIGIYVLALGALLAFSGCSMPSIKQPISTKTYYKRDIEIVVNGQRGRGILVAKHAADYKIETIFQAKSNMKALKNCHREEVELKNDSRQHRWDYEPKSKMEKEGCVLEFSAFTKTEQAHSWGTVYFEDPKGFPAVALCNKDEEHGKTTACHARAGSVQEIHFAKEMIVMPELSGCDFKMDQTQGKSFEYTMPPRKCSLIFATIESKGEVYHVHYSEGYQSILLRDE